jgi:hypothetical protein
VVGKVRIRFKVNVIEDACLVVRAIQLMTHSEFAEGYNLIKDMQGSRISDSFAYARWPRSHAQKIN